MLAHLSFFFFLQGRKGEDVKTELAYCSIYIYFFSVFTFFFLNLKNRFHHDASSHVREKKKKKERREKGLKSTTVSKR